MKAIKRISNFIKAILAKFAPLIDKCSRDNISAIAGQSAFFIILSSVPLTAFVVSLLQTFRISVDFIIRGLNGIFSEEMVKNIIYFLSDAYNNAAQISLISLIITLWSAAQGFHAITNGLNRVYNAYENRNWLYRRIRSMIFTIIFFLVILASLVVIVLGSKVNELLSPHITNLPDFIALIFHSRYILLFISLTLFFSFVYRNMPNITKEERKRYKFKSFLPGAVICTASWYVLSFAISVYVSDFNGFSVYGGLTRLAVIMIWLYFCMICFMVCAEINFVYHSAIRKFGIKTIFRFFKK